MSEKAASRTSVHDVVRRPCDTCQGSGWCDPTNRDICWDCNGKGEKTVEGSSEHIAKQIVCRPLYLAKHNEYFDESWQVLAAFTDKQLAFQFIDKTSDELAKTFDTSVGDFDDWHSFTIEETVLREMPG